MIRLKKKIYLAVLALHLSFALWASLFHTPPPKRVEPKHLTIKTLSPKPKVHTAHPAPVPLAKNTPKKPPPSKKAAPPQKTPPPTPPAKKKPAAAPAAKRPPIADKKSAAAPIPAKPKKKPIPQELLQELEESIAKIDEKRDKLYRRNKLEAAPAVQILKIDSLSVDETSSDDSYAETLVVHLKQALNLPDYGEVKIQLTLSKDGDVEKLVVVKSESEKNKHYLEKHLPRLKFPSLNSESHTFVLTFCNEV